MKVAFFSFAVAVILAVPRFSHPQVDLIRASHIQANVPDDKAFDALLKRDLNSYFNEGSVKALEVKYELLRRVPTQVGVAFPKFYAWVQVYQEKRLLEEGAVRMAAVEKSRFEIIQFLAKEEVKKDPDRVFKIFPKEVGDKIIQRAMDR